MKKFHLLQCLAQTKLLLACNVQICLLLSNLKQSKVIPQVNTKQNNVMHKTNQSRTMEQLNYILRSSVIKLHNKYKEI